MSNARYEIGDGGPPRIAFVVYNDVHRDPRVTRIANAAVDAGAQVRVFAFGGPRVSRYPAGVTTHEDGFEIERLSIRSIGHVLIDAGAFARRALRLGRPSAPVPNVSAADESPAAVPHDPVAEGAAAAEPATPSGLKGWTVKQWRRADRTVRQFSFWFRARAAILAWRPNLIHAHDANTLPVAAAVAGRMHVPFVYDSHELWTHRNVSQDRPLAKRLEGPMERLGARRAAGVITVSPSIAHWLQARYNLPELPTLVRNIPPFDGAVGERSAGRLRELAGLSAGARVVAYCGGITFNRGIERVIEAMPHLPPQTHFVLLGEGSEVYVDGLRRLIRRAEAEGQVHFIGAVPAAEVSAALSDADASVALTQPTVLSYEYSLPNKLFESVHAGVPVLVSATKDASALVHEYGVGDVVAPDASPEELAIAIERVMGSSERYREAARAAAAKLTWQQEVARLVELHRRVLGTARTGSR